MKYSQIIGNITKIQGFFKAYLMDCSKRVDTNWV